jgi:hypothetical protein
MRQKNQLKNRFFSGVLCIVLMLLCSSCGFFADQRYMCNIDDVKSVQIVKLDRYVEGEYRYEYTVLSEIPDCPTFVKRLNEVKHTVNWGDPLQMDVQYVVIKIDYCNGDFDLIHQDAQCFHRSGINQYGYFFFNDAQFNELISDYIAE